MERESFNYEYEPTVGQKRPDFTFELTDKNFVYFDVKRFNISDFDKRNNQKLYDLAERLKTIEKPYFVHLEQIEKELDFDLDVTFKVIEKWFLQNTLKEGESFNYKNLLSIEIIKTKGIKDYVLYSYSGENPKIHVSKPASDILSKIKTDSKYYNHWDVRWRFY
ncbi:MAG: hypothetical protein QMB24_17250 [Spirosomataceae bacterium]